MAGPDSRSPGFGPGATGEGEEARLDEERLRETVRVATRFLDDVIQVNRYSAAEIGGASRRSRKIGLGVMGFAELLIRLGVSYDSDAAPEDVERICRRAWELGLEGITVFRYGSRSEQVVEMGMGEEPHEYERGHACDPTECRL